MCYINGSCVNGTIKIPFVCELLAKSAYDLFTSTPKMSIWMASLLLLFAISAISILQEFTKWLTPFGTCYEDLVINNIVRTKIILALESEQICEGSCNSFNAILIYGPIVGIATCIQIGWFSLTGTIIPQKNPVVAFAWCITEIKVSIWASNSILSSAERHK